ncbi:MULTISPECIES: exopolyphosphatase [unclassified Schlesneria]|uniref:Ppx/GppA phosphatase family protein n=1 Tax=Schlesneria TaxID=656899 RepID=UPI0035A09A99
MAILLLYLTNWLAHRFDMRPNENTSHAPRGTTVTPSAVIDVGTTSIRMAIAEIDDEGGVRHLSALSQAVSLGKDTFTRGFLEKGTIEECVRVLKSYRRVLAEYGIVATDKVRVVATSAVREASNKLAFLDRVYTATGFQVVPIDEAEVNRITYLGIQPLLRLDPELANAKTVVTEVGGGSTELLQVKNADVLFAHTYRLGSLRIRQTLEAYHASQGTTRRLMATQIQRILDQILQQVSAESTQEMVALGGDMRFAARQLVPDWVPDKLTRIPVDALAELTNSVLLLNEDKLVHKYHITFPEAGTLGPALLAYTMMAQAFGLKQVIVASINLRDGLLNEMATRGGWNEDFSNQVIRSALDLGRKFEFDELHARQVAKLCGILFQGLRDEHQLDPRYELLLRVAALLHEVGLYVNTGSYHKHSMYLIQHSELFGLSRSDVQLVALTARYHRRASPKPTHTVFTTLNRDQRIAVVKMAAMLRIADALEASHNQRLHELKFSREGGRLIIAIPQIEDLSLEQLALKQSGSLFESTFGMPVQLRKMRP